MRYKSLILLLLLTCCVKLEVINAPEPRGIDTTFTKAHKPPKPPKPPRDTSDVDTTRIPIRFDVSVEDWDEENNIDI